MYVILFKQVLFFFFLSLPLVLFYLSMFAPRPDEQKRRRLSYKNAITPQTTVIQQNAVVGVL